MATQPREFEKDGYKVEITGPSNRCQVWIEGQPVVGLRYFRSLRAARDAAFGPYGWTKRHTPRGTLPEVLGQVRRHYHEMYSRMTEVGGTWHLYRTPGTNQFSIFHEDAKFDVPLHLAVQSVHSLTVDQVCARVQQLLRK